MKVRSSHRLYSPFTLVEATEQLGIFRQLGEDSEISFVTWANQALIYQPVPDRDRMANTAFFAEPVTDDPGRESAILRPSAKNALPQLGAFPFSRRKNAIRVLADRVAISFGEEEYVPDLQLLGASHPHCRSRSRCAAVGEKKMRHDVHVISFGQKREGPFSKDHHRGLHDLAAFKICVAQRTTAADVKNGCPDRVEVRDGIALD